MFFKLFFTFSLVLRQAKVVVARALFGLFDACVWYLLKGQCVLFI